MVGRRWFHFTGHVGHYKSAHDCYLQPAAIAADVPATLAALAGHLATGTLTPGVAAIFAADVASPVDEYRSPGVKAVTPGRAVGSQHATGRGP